MSSMDFAPIRTGMKIRRERRFSLRLRAEICRRCDRDQAEIIQVNTKNISPLGAYFITEAHLAINEEVEIRMYLPFAWNELMTAKDGPIQLTGFVVRIDDTGLAVAFHEDSEISDIFSSTPLTMHFKDQDEQGLIKQRRDS